VCVNVCMHVHECVCACVRVCVCVGTRTIEQILVGFWSELYHSELLCELPLAANCLLSKILFSVKIYVFC
jgi:hypothetical protein